MLQALSDLVVSFDDEVGLPEASYTATRHLISSLLGEHAGDCFARYIDATDNRFFLKEGTGIDCWHDIMAVAEGRL